MKQLIARLAGRAVVTGLVLTGTPTLAAALTPAPATAVETASSQPAPEFQALALQVEAQAERILHKVKGAGMAISMVHGDQVLLERGFGVTDTGSGDPVTADTVFRLASLSKAFAGTLATMLVEEGALNWDARIIDQLPTFRLRSVESARGLTLQDILSHRVGLPYNTYDRLLEQNEPYPVLVAKLEQVDSVCAAGDCYSYQNVAFSLVGDLVFAVTGDFYSHQVEKRIFHPLGMHGATFGRDGLEGSASWARPHVRRQGRWAPVRAKETYYHIPPAAGANASIQDLSLWMKANLGHAPDVLPAELLAIVHGPQVQTRGEIRGTSWRRERLRDAHYALGWRIYDYAGHQLLFHGGAVQGYRASIALLPEQDFGMAVLWNSESSVPGALVPTALDQLLGLPAKDWLQLDLPTRAGRLR